MHSAHSVGYEVYSRSHAARMKVEQRREQDYLQSQRILLDIYRKAQQGFYY